MVDLSVCLCLLYTNTCLEKCLCLQKAPAVHAYFLLEERKKGKKGRRKTALNTLFIVSQKNSLYYHADLPPQRRKTGIKEKKWEKDIICWPFILRLS